MRSSFILGLWRHRYSLGNRAQPLLPPARSGLERAGPSIGRNFGCVRTSGGRRSWQLLSVLSPAGRWPIEVTGHDPRLEPKWFDPYCPIRNVTKNYPPSILIHGTVDEDVPYQESENMARKLREHGIEHELIPMYGAGHGLSGAEKSDADRAKRRAANFSWNAHCVTVSALSLFGPDFRRRVALMRDRSRASSRS